MPKWNVRPPSAMRGSQKNARTGCCVSNGFTGQGYGGGFAAMPSISAVQLEAVNAGVVRGEWVGECAAFHDEGSEVFAVVLEHRGAELDSSWKSGEVDRAVCGRALSDGDEIEEAAGLACDEPD